MESIVCYDDEVIDTTPVLLDDVLVTNEVVQQSTTNHQLYMLHPEDVQVEERIIAKPLNDDSTSCATNMSDCIIMCQVCTEFQRKYKCPRCGIFTCSVDCVKAHKKQAGCNGIRDKTQFVPSKEFSSQHLRSDFHFLEDALQSKDTAHRTFVKDGGGTRGTKNPKPFRKKKRVNLDNCIQFSTSYQNLDNYSKGVKNLFHAVKDRGTKLLLLPNGMSKRLSNTSHIDPKSKAIMWRVNLAFILNESFTPLDLCSFDSFVPTINNLSIYQSEKIDHSLNPEGNKIEYQAFSLKSSLIGICLHNVNENHTIQDIVGNIMGNLQSGTPLKHLLKTILPFRDMLRCFMRVIPSPANDPLFTEILTSMELKSSLSGQSIIEYPTFYICLESVLPKIRLLITPIDEVSVSTTKDLKKQPKRKNPHDDTQIEKRSRLQDHQDNALWSQDKTLEGAKSTDDEDEDPEYDQDDSEDDADEGYDDFMQEFVNLQNVDIEELKSLISTKKRC